MTYVVRTDKLSRPHYFAGAMDTAMSPNPVITALIFNAWGLETETEANEVRALLGEDDWTISEVSDLGFSQNLAPNSIDEFLKSSTVEILDEDGECGDYEKLPEVAPAMEIYDHLVEVCEENEFDPTQQMHVLESLNFTFITELFAREAWHTALDRMVAELHRLMDEYPAAH